MTASEHPSELATAEIEPAAGHRVGWPIAAARLMLGVLVFGAAVALSAAGRHRLADDRQVAA